MGSVEKVLDHWTSVFIVEWIKYFASLSATCEGDKQDCSSYNVKDVLRNKLLEKKHLILLKVLRKRSTRNARKVTRRFEIGQF